MRGIRRRAGRGFPARSVPAPRARPVNENALYSPVIVEPRSEREAASMSSRSPAMRANVGSVLHGLVPSYPTYYIKNLRTRTEFQPECMWCRRTCLPLKMLIHKNRRTRGRHRFIHERRKGVAPPFRGGIPSRAVDAMTSSALASIKAPAAALRAPAAVSRARGRVAVAPIRAVSTAAEGSALREIVAEISGAAGACPLRRRGRSISSVVVARTSRRPGPSPRRVRCLFSSTRRTPRRGVSPTSPRRRIAQPPVASCLRRRHPDHSPFFPIPPLPERRGLTDHHRPAPPDVLLRSRRARQEAHRHVRLPPRAPGRGQVHRQPRHGLHRRGVVRVSLFS